MIEVGQKGFFSKTITETDVYNFAGICGDFNPVHVDKEKAKDSFFGRQVAHGMLCASFISTVIGMYMPGPGTIYMGQNIKFLFPVYIGDTINVEVTVKEIMDNKKAKLITLVTNQSGKRVIEGEALVKIP